MDLREYYREVREIERSFQEPFVVLVSEKTKDGGRAGVLSEVSAAIAASLLKDRRARAATVEEASSYRKEQAERWAEAQGQKGPQVQVMVVAEQELENFKTGRKRKEPEK